MRLSQDDKRNISQKNEEKIELKPSADTAPAKTSDAKKESDVRAVLGLFLNVHYGSWISTAFFVGICNGIIWGFLYWHIDNLGKNRFALVTHVTE